MRVLLITVDYPPTVKSAARLFSELAEDLTERGHHVSVLTSIPDRNLAESTTRKQRLYGRETLNGVRVHRVSGLPIGRNIPIVRGLEQFITAFVYLLIGVFIGRHQAVIVYSPPLPLGLTGYALARIWGGRVIVNVQDLYPQTVIDLGLLKSRALKAVAHWMERFVYRHADAITVHSEGNLQYVVRRGASAETVRVVHNWVDLDEVSPGPRDNQWRRDHNLDDTFVVSFAGTMGFAQGLEDILHIAHRLKEHEDIVFVMAGDGIFRQDLQDQAEAKGLTNVRFVPTQPPKEYVELLRASDVCLVPLSKDLKTPVVPGKLQSIMAAGRPAICWADPASDARRLIADANCGSFFPAGRHDHIAQAILELYRANGMAAEKGRNGRDYAEAHFGREGSTRIYDELIALGGGD
ncbi:MAG: glycosyltransferase family 4 protein [Chloroflexi bacterium]|nr:glycosyltransferase family 4 protein [Chloroflexota bacterium]